MRTFLVSLYKPGHSHDKIRIKATDLNQVYSICAIQFYNYQVTDVRQLMA